MKAIISQGAWRSSAVRRRFGVWPLAGRGVMHERHGRKEKATRIVRPLRTLGYRRPATQGCAHCQRQRACPGLSKFVPSGHGAVFSKRQGQAMEMSVTFAESTERHSLSAHRCGRAAQRSEAVVKRELLWAPCPMVWSRRQVGRLSRAVRSARSSLGAARRSARPSCRRPERYPC
jgi:hypothetical protein